MPQLRIIVRTESRGGRDEPVAWDLRENQRNLLELRRWGFVGHVAVVDLSLSGAARLGGVKEGVVEEDA